jgi:hypothetical protein
MQAQAKREALGNIAAIPDRLVDSYIAGTEESRRAKQQQMLEQQEARQKELHPLDIESRKSQLERTRFGLSEEQKAAQDAQRQREWLTQTHGDSGLTQEQYNFKLAQQLQEGQLKAQDAQIQSLKNSGAATASNIKLQNAQLQSMEEDRQVRQAAAQYQAAFASGDQKEIARLDSDLSKKLTPEILTMARNQGASNYRSQVETANLTWSGSPAGQETSRNLALLNQKASILQQVKANIAEYRDAPFGSDDSNRIKQNIIALLSKPEMGVEGRNAAASIEAGLGGLRFDTAGLSTSTQRIDSSLKNLENVIGAEIKQLEVQNAHVKVPVYLQNLDSTKNALKTAITTTTKKPPPNLLEGRAGGPQNQSQGIMPAAMENNSQGMGPPLPPRSQFRK